MSGRYRGMGPFASPELPLRLWQMKDCLKAGGCSVCGSEHADVAGIVIPTASDAYDLLGLYEWGPRVEHFFFLRGIPYAICLECMAKGEVSLDFVLGKAISEILSATKLHHWN